MLVEAAMTTTFTLAHLSDVHLAPVPWPRLAELDAKRALGLANWHRKRKRQRQYGNMR